MKYAHVALEKGTHHSRSAVPVILKFTLILLVAVAVVAVIAFVVTVAVSFVLGAVVEDEANSIVAIGVVLAAVETRHSETLKNTVSPFVPVPLAFKHNTIAKFKLNLRFLFTVWQSLSLASSSLVLRLVEVNENKSKLSCFGFFDVDFEFDLDIVILFVLEILKRTKLSEHDQSNQKFSVNDEIRHSRMSH